MEQTEEHFKTIGD
jgi:DNA-directed RNA polymerase specialized sigma24 family protein